MNLKSKLLSLSSCLFLFACAPDPLGVFEFDSGDSDKSKAPKSDNPDDGSEDSDGAKLNYGTIIDLDEIRRLDNKLKEDTGSDPIWDIEVKLAYETTLESRGLSIEELAEAINTDGLDGETTSSLKLSATNGNKKLLAANYAEVVSQDGDASQQYFWQSGCSKKSVDGNMLEMKTGLCDINEISKNAVKKTAVTHCRHKQFDVETHNSRVGSYFSGSEQVLCDRTVDKAVINIKSEIPESKKYDLPRLGKYKGARYSFNVKIDDQGGVEAKINVDPNLGGSGECKSIFIPLKISSQEFKIIKPKYKSRKGADLWFVSKANDTEMEETVIKSSRFYKEDVPRNTRKLDIYLACTWWLLQGEKAIEIR